MNLIVDFGNTSAKVAVFSNNIMVEKNTVAHTKLASICETLFKSYPAIKKALFASVGNHDTKVLEKIGSKVSLVVLDRQIDFPFKNRYKTKDTLGADRLALAMAAYCNYPNTDTLVIDAGTCITYDFVNHNGEYLGGAISPGLDMRYKALNVFTAKLPYLEPEFTDIRIGDTTKASIHSGVIFGVLDEIDGAIGAYKVKYPDLTVILTGGNSNFLSKQLKNSIFANSNFLLEGLNHILEFNSQG
ncbi:MAG TPA: type III pantothenate kinase [Aquaticitalea sp.]|nr:type III pantothenate kinase [Aquaticitalea sp.]